MNSHALISHALMWTLVWPLVWALVGLVVGSFCNVVILRLPLMLLESAAEESPSPTAPILTLSKPASHCPNCQTPLKPLELIPLVSFVKQRGLCLHCKNPISWQYPAVELLSALWWGFCAHQFLISPSLGNPIFLGISVLFWSALLWSLLGSALLCLCFIDLSHHLLPDALTQPLLWCGLIGAHFGLLGIDLDHALIGAVVGYASLWVIAWIYKILTQHEGMGQGDMKLLAVFGAWIGAWSLLPLVFLASSLGLSWGLFQMARHHAVNLKSEIAFGPFLIASFLSLLLFGPSQALELMGLAGVTPFAMSLQP